MALSKSQACRRRCKNKDIIVLYPDGQILGYCRKCGRLHVSWDSGPRKGQWRKHRDIEPNRVEGLYWDPDSRTIFPYHIEVQKQEPTVQDMIDNREVFLIEMGIAPPAHLSHITTEVKLKL